MAVARRVSGVVGAKSRLDWAEEKMAGEDMETGLHTTQDKRL